jgi:hypothetical protein
MSPRSIAKVSVLTLLGLGWIFLLPARADDHAIIEDAHHQLEQALNPGGDPPSSADLTAFLQKALDDLKVLPHIYRGTRVQAMDAIKSALLEIKNGGSGDQINEDIREADSEVRDIEAH